MMVLTSDPSREMSPRSDKEDESFGVNSDEPVRKGLEFLMLGETIPLLALSRT